jgi:flagellar hook assembly protein FlgD
LPLEFSLYQNYPNPFNPTTIFRYDLPKNTNVKLTIYDLMGKTVKNLVSDQQNSGYKLIQWNSTNNKDQPVSAGMYFYTIQAGEFRETRKMILLK